MNYCKIIAMAVTLLVQPSFALAQDTDTVINPFVVGGKKVEKISDIPWQVALVDSGTRNQFCGGTLIAKNWVLTAAHCVDDCFVGSDPDRVDIVAGTLRYARGGEQIRVEAIYIHPKWNNCSLDFDAALLKLENPSELGTPIEMIAPDGDLPVGSNVRVSGWGATSEGGPGTKVLLFATVPVVSNAVCNEPVSYDGIVTPSMFCAGKRWGGLDACQGDSGGPVDLEKKIVGIVSWGYGCARRLKYGVYTRVSSVSGWANETISHH